MDRIPDGRRDGRTVSPAEKAQARDVSLRRIGGLFTAHRGPLATVVAIIVASSIIAMATPFLLRAVIDRALPQGEFRRLHIEDVGARDI